MTFPEDLNLVQMCVFLEHIALKVASSVYLVQREITLNTHELSLVMDTALLVTTAQQGQSFLSRKKSKLTR